MGKKALKKKVMQGLDIFLLLNWHIYAHFLKTCRQLNIPVSAYLHFFSLPGRKEAAIFFSALLTFDIKVLEIFHNFWIFSGNTDFA